MAMTVGAGRKGAIAEINVTPMADVMIVLLIIFMVATPIIAGSPVRLPDAAHAATPARMPAGMPIFIPAPLNDAASRCAAQGSKLATFPDGRAHLARGAQPPRPAAPGILQFACISEGLFALGVRAKTRPTGRKTDRAHHRSRLRLRSTKKWSR